MFSFYSYYTQDGKNEAYIRLRAAKQQMLGRIKGNKTMANTKVLSEKLTKLFYPPQDIESQQISQQFNEVLKQVFEEMANKEFFEKDFNIGKGNYHQKNQSPQLVGTATLSAMQNLLTRIEKDMNQLLHTENVQKIEQITSSLDMKAQQAKVLIIGIIKDMSDRGVTSIKLTDKLGQQLAIGQAYNYLRALEFITRPGKVFTKTDMGNILEFALGMLDEDLNFTTQQVTKEAIEQINKQVQGSTPKVRMASGIYTEMYLDKNQLSAIIGQNFSSIQKTYQIGDMTLKRARSLDPGSKKYGKIDVYKNSDLRISAKNWSSLTYTDWRTNQDRMRGLGGAKLLDAIARTTSVLDHYMWLFQDKGAKNYYALAHTVARLSAYTDIALGFGNDTSANTLIINLRDKKNVLVINMNEEILKAINNKPSKFILAGYEPFEIERVGMQLGLRARSYGLQSSKLYYTWMYDFLANQRIFVEMSSSLKV